MSMTRKDYNKLAFHLAMQEPTVTTDYRATAWFSAMCEAVADGLIGSNPRFRREYFLEACRINYWTNRKQPR